LNGRIRGFTVLSWYCKTFIDDAHALFRDSDYSKAVSVGDGENFVLTFGRLLLPLKSQRVAIFFSPSPQGDEDEEL
jgi:hypothetical protein